MRVRFLIVAVVCVVIGIVVGLIIDPAGSFDYSNNTMYTRLVDWGAFVIIVVGLAFAANEVVLAIPVLISGAILTVTVRAACTWITNVVEHVRD